LGIHNCKKPAWYVCKEAEVLVREADQKVQCEKYEIIRW